MNTLELYREFVACMAAFLRDERYQPTLTPEDWGKLYRLAKRQSLSGALHAVTTDCPMPDTVRDRLRRDSFLTLTVYETQQAAQATVCRALSDAGVAHLLFKGAVVRRYYRNASMRTMGDIDMVIHESSREASDIALRALGFELTEKQPVVWVYKKEDVWLEVHNALKRYNAALFDCEIDPNCWTDARLKADATYHMSDEAEAAFVLSHMAMHFCEGGCGIRQLMDVAVLYERFPDLALWHGILTRLDATGLADFARRMLWLCRVWFGVEVDDSLTTALDTDTVDTLLTRLLSDGTFGTDKRLMLARMRRETAARQRGGTCGTLVRWVFPSPAYLKRQYGYAANPLLLPVAYVHRFVDGVTKHRHLHSERLRYVKDNQAELERDMKLFDAIGL